VRVDERRVNVEDVPGVPPLQAAGRLVAQAGRLPEQLADPAQVRVKDVAGLSRRIVAPDPVDKQLDRDRPPRLDRKRREHGLLPGRAEVEGPASGQYLDFPQQPELHAHPR
jgi:hypothetical protein